jgi:hypothetical protein
MTGTPVVLHGSQLRFAGQGLSIDLGGAEVWDSALRFPESKRRLDHASMLATLKDLLAKGSITSPFLAAFLERPLTAADTWSRAVRTEAVDIIDRVCTGLRTSSPQTVLGGITRAVGLGSGFTPSGDDFLTGLVGAYHYLGHRDEMQEQVFTMMEPLVRRTTLPSFFMLKGALRGHLPEALVALLSKLTNGPRAGVTEALRLLTRTGATSGEDMLAGLLTYLAFGAGKGLAHEAN